MRLLRPSLALLLALMAMPAFAYTIYLKDGSRLIAKEKYEVRGDLAIFIQDSGTQASIPFDQIDVKRTDEVNIDNVGTAYVIEGGQATDLRKSDTKAPSQKRIQDMIRDNEAGIRPEVASPTALQVLPAATATTPSPTNSAVRAKVRSGIAYQPFPDRALAGEIRGFVTGRGMTAVEVYAGTSATRPLLVYGTSSEGAVFKALLTAANALLHFQSARPGAIDGIELLCETPDGGLGGRFSLSPEQASDIVSGKTEITKFYVDNVIF
jgi:hypothetical protein